jgi:predicted metal-binding protein
MPEITKLSMDTTDLETYMAFAIEGGATHAKVVDPESVVTAPWVRWKCRFGCTGYDLRYCCPPDTPTPEETRAVIDCYNRAILFHTKAEKKPGESRIKRHSKYFNRLIELEGEMFKDGYYKAFLFLAGPCHLCKECAKGEGAPCNFGGMARPSMEACGIDVYLTARNNGFHIQPLREKGETQNGYCLMLVD